jgi:hypothetical protein
MAGSITNALKLAFGFGIGFQLAGILFMLVGLLFFIPGYILFQKEVKAERKGSATQVVAIVLMIIGAILLGGFGLGIAMSGINDLI